MAKNYREENVYEASLNRIRYVLDNFEKAYVSFSGGKDSGVLLNLCIHLLRTEYPNRKIGVQIMDNEANYTESVKFMTSILDKNLDILDVYWCCLPITLPCTVSSYDVDWQCWGVKDEHKWVQAMPDRPYVVNMKNHKFGSKFRENMHYDEFWDMFAEWYADGASCANMIGIRAAESLNRFRAIMNDKKEKHNGLCWTKKNTPNVFNVYPIYDWKTEDIWIANGKFEWEYNKLYDLFYKAGIPISKMRVASPFMSESKSSLNMYRVIDGPIWARLCARVHGANFIATYGKQLNYHSFKLPEGHTWKSFVKFLLDTLPESSGENFKTRFIQSIKYWGRVGRGVTSKTIQELKNNGIKIYLNGKTAHGSKTLDRVIIKTPPDHLDFLSCHNSDVTSWKRFAITILKNDHTCKYLGLAPTKEQMDRMKVIKRKYSKI